MGNQISSTIDGKNSIHDVGQTYFFSEPIAPPRPKKMVPKTIDVWIPRIWKYHLDNCSYFSAYERKEGDCILAKLIYEVEE